MKLFGSNNLTKLISLIKQALDKFITTEGTIISANSAYSELAEWSDSNSSSENRVGYFVCIDTSVTGKKIKKATSTNTVHGVVVDTPGFSGNLSSDKFDESGDLLPQYDYVCILGPVSVIDDGTCVVGNKCMPDDTGIAIPSSNNMGYHVLERIDTNHILIMVEPGADNMSRIQTSVEGSTSEFKFGVENGIPYLEEI